jgi:hypothetical protein
LNVEPVDPTHKRKDYTEIQATATKNYICDMCGKSFQTRDDLIHLEQFEFRDKKRKIITINQKKVHYIGNSISQPHLDRRVCRRSEKRNRRKRLCQSPIFRTNTSGSRISSEQKSNYNFYERHEPNNELLSKLKGIREKDYRNLSEVAQGSGIARYLKSYNCQRSGASFNSESELQDHTKTIWHSLAKSGLI